MSRFMAYTVLISFIGAFTFGMVWFLLLAEWAKALCMIFICIQFFCIAIMKGGN